MKKICIVLFVLLFFFSSAEAVDYRVGTWMKAGESSYTLFEINPETFIKVENSKCTIWGRLTYKRWPDNKEYVRFVSTYGQTKSLCFDYVKTDLGDTLRYNPPKCLDISKKHSVAEEVWISIAVVYAAEEARNTKK